MGTLKVYHPFFLFFFFLLLSHKTWAAPNFCPVSMCYSSSFMVQFPFQLIGSQQQPNCSYPGFDLACSSQGSTVLTLPQTGNFLVHNINYLQQYVEIYDPEDCLPQRLTNFSLSGSPYSVDGYANYSFLSCPAKVAAPSPLITTVNCSGDHNNNRSVLIATPSANLTEALARECQVIASLDVPTSVIQAHRNSFDFRSYIQLKWDVPNCSQCEQTGSICGYVDDSSGQIGCVDGPSAESRTQANCISHESITAELIESRSHPKVFKELVFSIALPAIICTSSIGIYVCLFNMRRNNGSTNAQQATVMPQHTVPAAVGLDQSIIDTYTKVTLGESCRVPGLNDGICPICLSEYNANEIVRWIPECEHCFHAECIDEWLKSHVTCPLCRNSPSPVHGN
ncbi:hypothetical protein Dimus_006638 [Dionaea muscipula]